MITVYSSEEGALRASPPGGVSPDRIVWVDMLRPDMEERRMVEEWLGLELPTREEMQEIEVSNRLYAEDFALYMTATVMTKLDTDSPEITAITFILKGGQLVTVRHEEPKAFPIFVARASRPKSGARDGLSVMMGLLDVNVDRVADTLERIATKLDQITTQVFNARKRAYASSQRFYNSTMTEIGWLGDLDSKARESLVSLNRLLTFLRQNLRGKPGAEEAYGLIKTQLADTISLTDHATFLSQKISFLLDAVLGLINMEQNAIIKIFSVAAVVFLPPTLIASVYGMNFDVMPELSWRYGYPWALGLMVLSAILPYVIFKRRGWL